MHRSAHTARRAVSVSRSAASPGVWVTDDVLADALHRFACISPSTTSRRHGSTVPGPLEHRKRSNRRRMNVAAVGFGETLPPLPGLPQWAQPSDTFNRLKQMIDPAGRIWRADNPRYQPPDRPTSRQIVSATPPTTLSVDPNLQSPIPVGAASGKSPEELHNAYPTTDAEPIANSQTFEAARKDIRADYNFALENLLRRSDCKSSLVIKVFQDDTTNIITGTNILLAFRHLAGAQLETSSVALLLRYLANAHARSQVTGWQFLLALHHLGQFQPDQLKSLDNNLALARTVWNELASQTVNQANNISLDSFLAMDVEARVHLIRMPDSITSSPEVVFNVLQDLLPLRNSPMAFSDSTTDLLQLSKSMLSTPQDLDQLLEHLPQPLIEQWVIFSVQALCAELQSQSGEMRQGSLSTLSTWLNATYKRLGTAQNPAFLNHIFPDLARVCEPSDIHLYFSALDTATAARIMWRFWICAKPGIAPSFVDIIDKKLANTPATMIRSERYRHLAPYVHLAWQVRQHLRSQQYAQTLVLDLLRESGAWKDFGFFCALIRKRYRMSIPLASSLKFLQQVPQSEAKSAAKVYLADRRVHYSDVEGLLDKMRQSKELHPALFKNFVRRPSAKRDTHLDSNGEPSQNQQRRHSEDMLRATSAVCRTERFSIRTRVDLASAFIRDARRAGVRAPRQLTRKLADMALAGSMRRGDKIPIDVVQAVLREVAEAHGQQAAEAVDRLVYRYWGWLIRGWRRERNAAARAERDQASLEAGIDRGKAPSP